MKGEVDMIKEKDIVLHNNDFARVVFLWKNKAVIKQGKRIFEVAKKSLTPLDPDVIDMTFNLLRNDYRYVA